MEYKKFEELTYEEKASFIRKEFGIIESNLYDIEKVVTQCYNIGYISNDIIDSYEAIRNTSLEIAIRIYRDYDNLKEAYIDRTSEMSALSDLKMIYIALNDSEVIKDLEKLIDKYIKRDRVVSSFSK